MAIIDRGKVVALGSPNELKSKIEGDSITLTFPLDDLRCLRENFEKAKQVLLGEPFVKKLN